MYKNAFCNLAIILGAVLTLTLTSYAQTVPGMVVQEYATLDGPVEIAFDPAGTAYVGHSLAHSGGGSGDPAKIHFVGYGGSPVLEYGDMAILRRGFDAV